MQASSSLSKDLKRLLTSPTSLVKIRSEVELKEAGELITRFVLAAELKKRYSKNNAV